jgi:hypothetical protein
MRVAFLLVLCVVNAQQGTIVLVSKFEAAVTSYPQLVQALMNERASLTAPVSVVSHGQNIGSVGPISKVRHVVARSPACATSPLFSFSSLSRFFGSLSTPTNQPGVPRAAA